MTEEIFIYRNEVGENIFGILHCPKERFWDERVFIVFVHGHAGYRIGPHQMFVKYARKLSKHGFYCLRFDFREKGYSEGDHLYDNFESKIYDLAKIVKKIRTDLGAKKIILLGICSGAKTALFQSIYGKTKIEHLILLSTSILNDTGNLSNAISQTKNFVVLYLRKLVFIDTWKRLIQGRIDFSTVNTILFKPFKRQIKSSKSDNNKSNLPPTENLFVPFSYFIGDTLLIHGEKDPETNRSIKQIKTIFDNYHKPYEIHIIKNANHSFYSIKWENEIFEIINHWLIKRISL